mgnify:CR=1 FL=1|tara:strand:- start:3548 stop:3976 length:429 start_codon:yes stop_codon:yes gene_type:complete
MSNKAEVRSAILKTGTTVTGPGYLLTMDGTSNTLDLVTWGETVLGISADESERDSSGLVTAAGATVGFRPLGGVIMVASKASQTYTTGLPVYADNSGLVADGDDSGGSTAGKIIGLYIGAGVVTSAAVGELIPVMTSVGSAN